MGVGSMARVLVGWESGRGAGRRRRRGKKVAFGGVRCGWANRRSVVRSFVGLLFVAFVMLVFVSASAAAPKPKPKPCKRAATARSHAKPSKGQRLQAGG